MTRVKDAFQKGKAFIPFITCGYPNIETKEKLIRVMVENGADLIELGVPFSDPTAEGPVIQQASALALDNGLLLEDVFNMVIRLRRDIDVPMVFMTYANLIYKYGITSFAKKAAAIGMNGIILPDVPYEEKGEFAKHFRQEGLDFISLIAPTSNDRIKAIASQAEGFVYVVSSLGVTGMRSKITTDIASMVDLVKATNPEIPIAIGFGISNPIQAKEMALLSDGVIVGSAIVKKILDNPLTCHDDIGQFVKEMKMAIE